MNIHIGCAPFLFAALDLIAGCGNLDDHTPSQNVAYAPDGSLIVFAGALRIFDRTLKNETHKAIPIASSNEDRIDSFVLSADGSTAAVSHSTRDRLTIRNAVELFRIPTGEVVNDIQIDIPPTPPIALLTNIGLIALSPQGDLVFAQNRAQAPGATSRAESDSSMFRVSDGARLWGGYWLTSPVFSVDGRTLFATFLPRDGTSGEFDLMALDALTGTVKFSVDIRAAVDISLVGNGELIAGVWGSEEGTASALWSATDGSLIRSLPPIPGTSLYGTHSEGYPAFACWLAGDLCAVGLSVSTAGTSVSIWRTDGTAVRTIDIPFADREAPNDFAFSPDGQLIAIAGDRTAVYRISDGARLSEKSFPRGIF